MSPATKQSDCQNTCRRALPAETLESLVGSETHLFRDLLGLGPMAEHPEGDAEDPMLIGAHELLEGARGAGPQAVKNRWRVAGAILTRG
jgi:hypothetical protein